MSATVFVEYRGNGFWAYDIILKVLIKHLIDAAERFRDQPWIKAVIEQWRINGVVGSEFSFMFDDSWNKDQVALISQIIQTASANLKLQDQITAAEISTWRFMPDDVIHTRGLEVIPTSPVIQLAEAMNQLLDGKLPESPPGTAWFFTHEDGPQTLKMNK